MLLRHSTLFMYCCCCCCCCCSGPALSAQIWSTSCSIILRLVLAWPLIVRLAANSWAAKCDFNKQRAQPRSGRAPQFTCLHQLKCWCFRICVHHTAVLPAAAAAAVRRRRRRCCCCCSGPALGAQIWSTSRSIILRLVL
jgi:hypothetical protein